MRKLLVIIGCVVCISAGVLIDIYEALEVTKEGAKKCLMLSIAEGSLQQESFDLKENAKKLSKEDQAMVTRQLILLAKEYSTTEEFQSAYKKWRKEKLNPDQKSKLGLPKLGKMLDNKVKNTMDKGELEKRYPSDPQDLIRTRLTDFLAVSADVDFDAELTAGSTTFANPEYEKKKDGYWKMCYRAGREVVTAAREEAQKWLSELK